MKSQQLRLSDGWSLTLASNEYEVVSEVYKAISYWRLVVMSNRGASKDRKVRIFEIFSVFESCLEKFWTCCSQSHKFFRKFHSYEKLQFRQIYNSTFYRNVDLIEEFYVTHMDKSTQTLKVSSQISITPVKLGWFCIIQFFFVTTFGMRLKVSNWIPV